MLLGDRNSLLLEIQVDAVFFTRLRRILRIVIPSIRSKEATLLILHSIFLVLRTLLSLYVASLDGAIVSALVRAQPKLFLWNILRFVRLNCDPLLRGPR